ncbi:MAG: DUF1439 domain-containing protein [Rhodoferax sp.]|nr:DUF1439 domain-containing protein [Rhodoferax sp.]
MRRRLLFPLALWLALGRLARAETSDTEPQEQAPPHTTVSMAQMQAALAQRFPLRYPVPGLLNLDLQTPRLQLLPQQNRLGASMAVEAAGPALQRSHQGMFTVDFALRYEASDTTIRAYRLHLSQLQFPSLQPSVVALLNSYAPALAEQALLEVVLYRLRPQDLALADGLGMQPGSLTVTERGVVVGLVPKPL